MEAVPRMPMLSFELKQSPEFVEFGPALKQYIRDHYGEDPAHYNKSCNELEQLRQSAVHVSHDFMGCSVLKKYYAQLQFLQGRFPMTELGEASMPFTWEDVHSGREVTHNDIKFEQAAILYNIGCLHSLLGALDTRQSADGMKVSCTHFQCATWAYEHLRDHYGSSGMSLDMSHELLTFQSNLMLAQAQECILEKSMADGRKSTITAKVSAQIVEFYNTALKSLTVCNGEELISSKQFKDWKKKIDIKVLFYLCITNYYMGQQSQEQQKWGQCLAYYTLSLKKLEECEKLAKNEPSDVHEALRFTHDVVEGKHQAAKKDNDFVYHEKVPEYETLPEVKGALLVKGIPFNANDPEISGPDIFMKLVPMSAHEAASLYSEEKATLLRRTASEIAEKDEELNQYLASLQLDQTELNPEPERLPQQLLEKCAAISVRPNAIKDLVDSMTSVSNVATEVDLGIQEIQQLLQEESKAELEYQELFGKRAPNIILSEIAKECAKFEEGHRKGSQSNTDLHRAMNTHINNLKLLSSPLEDIQTLLPSVDKERGPESADVIKELNMLMNKVEEMRAQRQTLEQTLRKEIMEDDITGTLAKQEGMNKDTVFAEQLKKHDKNSTLIRQNLAAQGNILRALTEANAKYATVRRATRDTIIRRDQVIRDLINSYDIYEDLMAKSQKGLEFYKKIEANVQKLLSRCRGVCKVQQEEREQMMNRYKPKDLGPARPTASKPQASTGIVQNTELPPMTSLAAIQSVKPMFDGPKLKDYLPFMKPNTFGKKAGSPDLSKADPAVQSYFSKTGSLPNSGTASPVHVPNISGSVPASPDHFRQSKFSPHLQGLNEGHPGLQDLPDGQGQQSLTRQQAPSHSVQPQGHQGFGLPQQNQTPVDGRIGIPSRGSSQSPSPQQLMQYVNQSSQGFDSGSFNQSQFSNTMIGDNDQYVPLNEKWKRESQAKGRVSGGPLQHPGEGQIPYPQSQNIDSEFSQGYAGSRVQPSVQVPPRVPVNQQTQPGINADQQHISQTRQNQLLNRHGSQMPSAEPRTSQFQTYMQYHVPNEQSNIYGQQSMVGYREITNTVSSHGSPVISSNKDGQAKLDHYRQVAGGHRHLQGGTGQLQNVAETGQGGFAAPQQPGLSNEQYWQQQMQQQQERLSHRNFPHQIPSTRQGALPSQDPNVQGQIMPPQGEQSQGLVPQVQGQNPHGYNQYMHGQAVQSQVQPEPGQNLANTAQQFQHPVQPNTAVNFQQTGSPKKFQVQQPQTNQQQQQHSGLPQQNEVPGMEFRNQPMHSGTVGQAPHTAQFGQQVQQPIGQQATHSQQGMAMQSSISGQQPVGALPQQFPQQAPNSQSITSYGQQGSPYQTYKGQQQQQPGQSQQFSQTMPQIQPQQQIQSQQYPPQFQQNLPVANNQSFQPNQTGLVSQHQQVQSQTNLQQHPQGTGSQNQNQAVVYQRPNESGSPHPTFSAAQPSYYQQPNMNQVFPQSGQVQQPTQHFSPTHRPQPDQAPLAGVQSIQGNAQQMFQSIQPSQQAGQGRVSLNEQQQQKYGQLFQGQSRGQGQYLGSQYQGRQVQSQSGQFGVHTVGSQGKMYLATSQMGGQQYPYQPTPQQPSQGQQTQPFHQPQLGQPLQGQSGQTFQAPAQQAPAVNSLGAVPCQQIRQTFPVIQNQGYQEQTYPFQGQVEGRVQGQPQSQHFHGSIPTPSIPPPAYSESSINNRQGVQGQLSFPTQGHQQEPNIGQGQMNQSYVHPSIPNQHMQHQINTANQQTQQVRGQMPGLMTGPVVGQVQGQPQGQNNSHVPQQMQFPGHPPALQPQILQPTVVHTPKGQDDNKGFKQDKGQGHLAFDTDEVPSVLPAGKSIPPIVTQADTIRPTNVQHPGPLDSSLNLQQVVDQGQSEGRSIPASRQLSTASSLDEILSSSPDTRDRVDTVLAPKVLTAQEIQQQKEDQLKNSNVGVQSKDPYKDRTKLDKFVTEVEKFAKFIEGYEKPSCSGPTPLDSVFKELTEEQEKAGRQQALAIARCYPMKNRDQDIMPFDDSRVLISSLKDDYINASWINDVSPSCPKFIATQWPLPVTLVDFWLSIYEQGVEVIAALSSEIETGKKFPVYLPEVKGETISHGPVQLTLQSVKKKPFWTERILHLRHSETKSGRTLVHLHYSTWPVSGFPEKVSYLLQFITEVHSFYRQQRSLLKPIVVHCSNGVGRTGIFLLIYMGMMELNHGHGIINLPEVAGKMLWKRRNLIHKKDQLKYCYDAILYYAQDILAKQGILIHKASFGDQLPKPGVKSQSWEPGEDILFGSMSFSNLQTNIAKLGTKSETSGLDHRLEMLKNGEMEEKKEDHSKIEKKSSSGSILPDLVQTSPGRSLETKSSEIKTNLLVNKTWDKSNPMDELFDDFESKLEIVNTSGSPVIHTENNPRTDKFSSPGKSLTSSPAHSSHESSGSPQVTKKIDNTILSSLTELQDPNTFTIGKGESNKKKKITKADFTGDKKKEDTVYPDDPLSSLDPFWSVKQ